MILQSLPLGAKFALDIGICATAGAAFVEWLQGMSALAAVVVAGLLGLVRLIDACVVLYERRTIQKMFGRAQRTRKGD